MSSEECDRRGPGGECCRDHEPCPDFPAPVTGETTDAGEGEWVCARGSCGERAYCSEVGRCTATPDHAMSTPT